MKKFLAFCLAFALAGLILSSLTTIIPESPDTWIRMDIGRLEMALAQFKMVCGVSYVPSRIKLSETCDYPRRDQPDTLDYDSVRFFKRLWPEIVLDPGTEIDWNGDGRIEGNWILEGDECLVFFLGGIPGRAGGNPTCLGFSTDAKNPASAGGPRRGPFYEAFNTRRLLDLHGRGFYSYLDRYEKQPYAYFSSYGKPNGYNRYGGTDCPSLGVWPYAEALAPEPRFLSPTGFQIISAGRDCRFGPGTDTPSHVWSPATATGIPAAGRDDLSNFSRVHLGTPQKDE